MVKTANSYDLSIIIVNWNTKELLRKCIRSIEARTKRIKYKIIVVDNNSSDGSRAMLKKEFATICDLLLNEENVGFSRGNNQALRFVQGRYIVFLNPDTELVSDALSGLVELLDRHQDVGAGGCKILNEDGTIQFTCARTFPTPFNQFCYFLFLNRLFPKARFCCSQELEYWDHCDSREVDAVSGACMIVRTKILEEIGGFDESTFMYAEDVDLCFRIQKLGWRIFYLAGESIIHHSAAASKQLKDKRAPQIMLRRAHHHFIKKHYGKRAARIYRLIVLFGSIIRLGVIWCLMPIEIGKGFKGNELWKTHTKYFTTLLWALGMTERISRRVSED